MSFRPKTKAVPPSKMKVKGTSKSKVAASKSASLASDEALAKALQKEEHEYHKKTNASLRAAKSSSSRRRIGKNGADLCMVPCIIGQDGVCVEMMVDTGAKSSFMALSLALELKLPIDGSYRGVAAGVGRVPIVGMVRNLNCQLGHVQFQLDFRVMDTPNSMLLLGLDLMRRYKCIVDLEKDVVVFGGRGGVEIPLMPGDEQSGSVTPRDSGPEISV